jgi:putative addiction module component (TIGR02574 family)
MTAIEREQKAAELLALPAPDRWYLAQKLARSLEDEDYCELSAEWRAEIRRRIQEADSGQATHHSLDEMMAAMDHALREARK